MLDEKQFTDYLAQNPWCTAHDIAKALGRPAFDTELALALTNLHRLGVIEKQQLNNIGRMRYRMKKENSAKIETVEPIGTDMPDDDGGAKSLKSLADSLASSVISDELDAVDELIAGSNESPPQLDDVDAALTVLLRLSQAFEGREIGSVLSNVARFVRDTHEHSDRDGG